MQGPYSRNPLAYKYYNAEEEILGKKMKVSALNSTSMLCKSTSMSSQRQAFSAEAHLECNLKRQDEVGRMESVPPSVKTGQMTCVSSTAAVRAGAWPLAGLSVFWY
jgi:hypothetical protein